jgi:hypothetical protein
MPHQFATVTMEGTSKTGKPCKIWRDEFEEDSNIMEIKRGRQ